MIVEDRDGSRRIFLETWDKYRKGESLDNMETLILQIILLHPEYHQLLSAGDQVLAQDFGVADDNPFLHMGLHIAVSEQLQSDRPFGVRVIYQSLTEKYPDEHQLQHLLMECLEKLLWQAREEGRAIEESEYLECLRSL